MDLVWIIAGATIAGGVVGLGIFSVAYWMGRRHGYWRGRDGYLP